MVLQCKVQKASGNGRRSGSCGSWTTNCQAAVGAALQYDSLFVRKGYRRRT